MDTIKTIKQILSDKGISHVDFAEMVDRAPQTIYNTFVRGNISCRTLESWLKALNCEIIIVDKRTGKKYK